MNISVLRLILGEHDPLGFHFYMAFLVVQLLNQRQLVVVYFGVTRTDAKNAYAFGEFFYT